jgi:hypothetical protein
MPHGTLPPQLPSPRSALAAPSYEPQTGRKRFTATHPLAPLNQSLEAKREGPASTPDSARKGRDTQKRQRAAWATLDLRQDWADSVWLRAHLTGAGLRVATSNEPATVARVKAKLRGIGVQSAEIQAAVGMTVAGFLKANPRLPLWAALAMVLEAAGRFTPANGGAL